MARDEESMLWAEQNERLNALSVDDFEWLNSDVFRYVIHLRSRPDGMSGPQYDWRSHMRGGDVMGEVPESPVLAKYGCQENTFMYVTELSYLVSLFGISEGWKVLEVGGGFGNFCRVFNHVMSPVSYTMLDNPPMLRFAKQFLNEHELGDVELVESDDMRHLAGRPFDLFVSNICLNETESTYRQRLFDQVLPGCFRCFIIDGGVSGGPEFNAWISEELPRHFPKLEVLELTTPWGVTNVYMGEKE